LFESCIFSGCKKLDLPKEELEWFNSYNVGQTLYYKNQYDDIDTLIVYKNNLRYSPCNKFELSEYQYQIAEIRINDKNNKNLASNSRVQLTFTQKEDELSLKHIHVFDYHFNGSNLNKELNDTTINLQYFQNEKVKCLIFGTKDNLTHDTSNNDLKKFYWNKEKGLVKYIIQDTLEYEIFK
jgi:hypothetical protein